VLGVDLSADVLRVARPAEEQEPLGSCHASLIIT
jgi:hypothetical protein